MNVILTQEQTIRALKRMSHQLLEMEYDVGELVLCGIKNKGYEVAKMIKQFMDEFSSSHILLYPLEIRPFRDDEKKDASVAATNMNITGKVVVLIDDVIFTGRSTRAGIDAILHEGRPKVIKFATLIDRGHRELPIRPDIVGKNIPSTYEDKVVLNTSTMEVSIQ